MNLDHVSKVELSEAVDKGAIRSTEAFLQSKLNTNKLEKRRIRHLEEKQNAAYALKLGIKHLAMSIEYCLNFEVFLSRLTARY